MDYPNTECQQHGVPISVKEHIGIEDLTLNGGYAAWYCCPLYLLMIPS